MLPLYRLEIYSVPFKIQIQETVPWLAILVENRSHKKKVHILKASETNIKKFFFHLYLTFTNVFLCLWKVDFSF